MHVRVFIALTISGQLPGKITAFEYRHPAEKGAERKLPESLPTGPFQPEEKPLLVS